MSGIDIVTKVVVGSPGAERRARYRQIKISVIGRKSRRFEVLGTESFFTAAALLATRHVPAPAAAVVAISFLPLINSGNEGATLRFPHLPDVELVTEHLDKTVRSAKVGAVVCLATDLWRTARKE